MSFSISIVQDAQALREFQTLPLRIYRNDPNWVCPLNEELEDVFI